MSDISKGVLIFNEWFEAMERLSAKDYKALMIALYNAQINNIPPPEFTGRSKIVATMIFPCIERRKQQSRRGLLSAAARLAKQEKTNVDAPLSAAGGVANTVANGDINQRREKKSKEKYRKEESNTAASDDVDSAYVDTLSLSHAKGENNELDLDSGDITAFQGGDEHRGYGVYQNVYLSDEEYLKISRTIPNAQAYVDRFSQKLHDKGYQYPNHAKAILDWYESDKSLPSFSANPHPSYANPPQNSVGSFDTDEFFEAAVRRSLGIADKEEST